MSSHRRKRIARALVLPALGLAALTGLLLWSQREQPYKAGEHTEGLVDSLARRLPPDCPKLSFTDVAAQAGLAFRHFPAERGNRLPEDMGSGVALGDIDGDGWVDVFLVNEAGALPEPDSGWPAGSGSCRMYRNRGDGSFEDVTASSGTGLQLIGMAALFLDADSDGDLDLLVSAFPRLVLLNNDGTGRFTDDTARAGLADLHGFWTGLAAGDIDRDGDVDALVCGYVRYEETPGASQRVAPQSGLDIPALLNPSTFEPERNLLLVNGGDGTFTDRAAAAGVENISGRSLGAIIADLDNDGWPDIYVANDVSDNALFRNRGDGTFEELATRAGVADYRGAMGLALGDFDNDLDLDLYITHWIGQENALYVNVADKLGAGAPLLFMDEADRVGLGQIALGVVGWATGFMDLDNDGRLDLFCVNGHTIPSRDDRAHLIPQRSQLFWNAGPGRGFFELGDMAGDFFTQPRVGRGGAVFDYDLDGDEDLAVVQHGGAAALLRADGATGHSLLLRLRMPQGNRFALGATARLKIGGEERLAVAMHDGSYLSQHAVGDLHVGLGAAAQVDSIRVTWPDGRIEEAGPFAADSLVNWTAGSPAIATPLPGKATAGTLAGAINGAALGASTSLTSGVTTGDLTDSATSASARRAGREALAPVADERTRGLTTGGAAAAKPASVADQRAFYAAVHQAANLRLEGRHVEALAAYQEALLLWPGHEECLYYAGHCLADLGREPEALATWTEMARLHPESSRAWMQLGRMRLPGGDPSLDDLGAAEAAFDRAHHINGEETGPVVQQGVVALLRGDLARADALLADAATSNARSVEARYWRAVVAWRRKDVARAQALLSEARALAPPPAAEPAPGEGHTATGLPLLATGGVTDKLLDRWRTLQDRPNDAEAEFSGLNWP